MTAAANNHRNGTARAPRKPAPFSDAEAARLAVRVSRSRQPPDKAAAARLDPEWAEGVIQAAENGPEGLDFWLRMAAVRHRSDPPKVEAYRRALETARAEPPGDDEPAVEPAGPPPFDLGLIDTATFFAEVYRLEWLVRGLLVADQMGVIGGPSKSLKTSILIDLAISLASGDPFLGRYPIPLPVPVGLISGESGRAVIQANAKQVCIAKGIAYEAAAQVFWGFGLPALTNPEHLAVLRKAIRDRGLKVVLIDPLYMSLLAGNANIDAKNMFQMGPVLDEVARACLEEGCTPIVAHHFVKKREDPYSPASLEDLAFSGVGQFCRQWMLLARRERYDIESGIHKFTFTYGGSAGHSGEVHLDVDTGQIGEDLNLGRKWLVNVSSPSESLAARQDEERARREAREAEKLREAEARQAQQLQGDAEKVYGAMVSFGQPETISNISARAKLNHLKTKAAMFILIDAGRAREATAKVRNRNSTRDVAGYEAIGLSGGPKLAQGTLLESNPD
jgi:hypothetical protein